MNRKPGKWKIVAAPDSYRVHLYAHFDQFDDPRSLMSMTGVTGIGEYGEECTIAGPYVARAFDAKWFDWSKQT